MVSWYKEFEELRDVLLPCEFLLKKEKNMTKKERKKWFFKPLNLHAGKGVVSGKTISQKRFSSLEKEKFLAQKLVTPHKLQEGLKYELRFFTYEGKVQLVGASLYKGQTPHFSTKEEGLVAVKIID